MLEAFFHAFTYFGHLGFSLAIFAGVIVGLIVGILPGISGLGAIVLVLPFVFMLKTELALPFMLAIGSVAFTAGSITAILLNIPGENANAATMLDGFPMAQRGQAGRALGAGVASSTLGGITSVALALIVMPLVVPLVLTLRTGDMVFIILMGLSFIAVLGRGSMVKGLISGCLGLLLSFVGLQMSTGLGRFNFGSLYLYEGLPMISLALGIFALPEMITLGAEGGSIAKAKVTITGLSEVIDGIRDVFRRWTLWLRSTIIGYVIGIIPGIGAMTAVWVSYGQAKQMSKHPEEFGTGIVEGVIAPQSAVGASHPGDLLVTLLLGIPGSASMAIILGAMLMLGITPSVDMVTKHLDLSFSLIMTIAAANLLGGVICVLVAPSLAKIAFIPGRLLIPPVIVITFVAAFASRGYFLDVIIFVIFGAVGLVLKKFDFNRPAVILGFILGLLFEQYLFMALMLAGPLFFLTPASIIIICITVGLFSLEPLRKLLRHRRGAGKKSSPVGRAS